jgi:dienelactone hydrolase
VRAFCFMLALLGLAGCEWYQFHPSYETVAGPASARGVIIWSHGTLPLFSDGEGYDAPLPAWLGLFRKDGWDVYQLDRGRLHEEPHDVARKLDTLARDLRQAGYKRIVLAGQSGGAFISLLAAAHSGDVDAVLALAPAYFGPNTWDNIYFMLNTTKLVESIDDIRHGLIVAAFFQDDDYDPPLRSASVERALSAHAITHLVIDHPDGLAGHFAGLSADFATRFGACLVEIADTGVIPTSCDSATERASR